MSINYFLFSAKANRAVIIGAVELDGVKVWPTEYGGAEFIRWVIENSIDDVQILNEHQLKMKSS